MSVIPVEKLNAPERQFNENDESKTKTMVPR